MYSPSTVGATDAPGYSPLRYGGGLVKSPRKVGRFGPYQADARSAESAHQPARSLHRASKLSYTKRVCRLMAWAGHRQGAGISGFSHTSVMRHRPAVSFIKQTSTVFWLGIAQGIAQHMRTAQSCVPPCQRLLPSSGLSLLPF